MHDVELLANLYESIHRDLKIVEVTQDQLWSNSGKHLRSEILECFVRNFNFPKEAIADDLMDRDARCFVVADGDVKGFYLLHPGNISDSFPGAQHKYTGRGIQGIALCLDSEYRGTGLGRQLIDIPQTLGYDYVWGIHLHKLNNLDHWLKRRELVLDTDSELGPVYVTAHQF